MPLQVRAHHYFFNGCGSLAFFFFGSSPLNKHSWCSWSLMSAMQRKHDTPPCSSSSRCHFCSHWRLRCSLQWNAKSWTHKNRSKQQWNLKSLPLTSSPAYEADPFGPTFLAGLVLLRLLLLLFSSFNFALLPLLGPFCSTVTSAFILFSCAVSRSTSAVSSLMRFWRASIWLFATSRTLATSLSLCIRLRPLAASLLAHSACFSNKLLSRLSIFLCLASIFLASWSKRAFSRLSIFFCFAASSSSFQRPRFVISLQFELVMVHAPELTNTVPMLLRGAVVRLSHLLDHSTGLIPWPSQVHDRRIGDATPHRPSPYCPSLP